MSFTEKNQALHKTLKYKLQVKSNLNLIFKPGILYLIHTFNENPNANSKVLRYVPKSTFIFEVKYKLEEVSTFLSILCPIFDSSKRIIACLYKNRSFSKRNCNMFQSLIIFGQVQPSSSSSLALLG